MVHFEVTFDKCVSILGQALSSMFAVPLTSRIHEGLIFSNRDKRTLLDKMIILIDSLGISQPFYLVADAYYASRPVIQGLLAKGNHLITRVKSNSVAYFPVPRPERPGKGRPKKYGQKIKVASLPQDESRLQKAKSPVYGEGDVTIQYAVANLIWRSAGIVVRFVVVRHPRRGVILLMSTDTELDALEIIRIYGFRFKIEVSFKQALRTIGTFAYHFWMKAMTPLRRVNGNQYLHRKSPEYRESVKRKVHAYHVHIQLGCIAQGLLHILAATVPELIWKSFGSWLRTIRPGLAPSEQVTANALQSTFPLLLATPREGKELTFVNFLLPRIDADRIEGSRLIA